ncbi:MAG: hypothetical protein LLG15_11180 [Betaproteobacteria bacterium]|nr:hypothetical protein [Betaproteobacteria bacterium]
MNAATVPNRPHYPSLVKPEPGRAAEVRRALNLVVDATRDLDQVWLRHDRAVKDDLIQPTFKLQCLEQRLSNLYNAQIKEASHV